MTAADDMRYAIQRAMRGHDPMSAASRALEIIDYTTLLDGLTAADHAAQAYKLAYEGAPPVALTTYHDSWQSGRTAVALNPINGTGITILP